MKYLFYFFCISLSLFLVYLSYQNLTEASSTEKSISRYQTDSTKIDLSHFLKGQNKEKIVAIGVITQNTCSSCYNELLEFYEIINKVDQKFFEGKKIKKVFAVLGSDSASALYFKKSQNISENVVFILLGTKVADKLIQWNKERDKANQWVFIDQRSSTIYSRILVLNYITPLKFKRDIVNQVIFTKD